MYSKYINRRQGATVRVGAVAGGPVGRRVAITHDLYGNVTRAFPINICECVGSVSKMN